MADAEEFASILKSQFELLNSNDNKIKLKGLNRILLGLNNFLQQHQTCSEVEAAISCDVIVAAAEKSSESCREVAIEILQLFVSKSMFASELDIYLITFVDRCSFNGVKCDSSEEIRCQLMRLFGRYLKIVPFSKLESHLEVIVNIVGRSLDDPCPEVKTETCACFLHMNEEFLKLLMRIHPMAFNKQLAQTLRHQRNKVRIACIKSIGLMAMCADAKFIEGIYSNLAQTFLDEVPQVRHCATRVVGSWLVTLPVRRHLWERIIALFLPSLADEVPEVRCLARKLWISAGKQFEREADGQFMENGILNLNLEPCPYVTSELQSFPAGCKIIVCKSFAKLLPAIGNDLGDWMDCVTVKASHLLYQLIANAKEGVAPHILLLIDTLIKSCKNTQADVLHLTTSSARLVGYYVESDMWCPVILKSVDDSSSLTSVTASVTVLQWLLSGCRSIHALSQSNVINSLAHTNICQNDNIAMADAVLSCVETLLNFPNFNTENPFVYFSVLQFVHETHEALTERFNLILTKLTTKLGFQSTKCVWNSFGLKMIQQIEFSTPCEMWTTNSVEWKIFNHLLKEIDLNSVEFAEESKRIIEIAMLPDNEDHLIKFNCLKSLGYIFDSKEIDDIPKSFYLFCIQNILIPNLIWRPGKAASYVTAAAIAVIYVLFNKNIKISNKILAELIKHLINLCESDVSTSRHLSCRILEIISNTYSAQLNCQQFLHILPALISRMDDDVRDIRIISSRTLGKFLAKFLESDWHELYPTDHRNCLQSVTKKLALHLLDEDQELQNAALVNLSDLVGQLMQE